MSIATCPSSAELEGLLLGGFPAPRVDLLEQHVLDCADCLAKLKAVIGAKDTFAGILRDDTRRAAAGADHPAVAALMQKLQTLRPTAASSSPQGTAMITIVCSACQKKLSVKEELAGKKAKCPACGQVLAIPAQVAAGGPFTTGSSGVSAVPVEAMVSAHATLPPAIKPDETISTNVPDSRFESNLTDFLAPPQIAGEIGRLGKYRILKVLGHGGMGVVYMAEDPALRRTVAVKAMLPTIAASANAGKRFLREAQSMAAVEHDHIVRIYQVDEDRGVPFLAMEFLKGEPLDERLKHGDQLPLADVLRIGREIAEALSAAHATGLIHRDIKPANVWLESKGEGRRMKDETDTVQGSSFIPHSSSFRVKILDFGLARAASKESGLTQEGAIIGTPAYMSPEQTRGEVVDARTDLFSLGVVLYRLCTGKQPFQGKDTVSTLMEVALHEPPPPAKINRAVPQEVSDLVMKLLEKDAAKRFATADDVVHALRQLHDKVTSRKGDKVLESAVGDTTATMPPSHPLAAVVPRPVKKRSAALVAVALAAVFGLLVLAGGAVYYWQTNHGIVRIEIDDPDIKVVFDKDGPTISGADKKDIKLRAGEFGLRISRGDLDFDTDKFILKRGEKITLKIEWLKEGKLQAVQDGKVVKEALAKVDGTPIVSFAPLDPAWLKAVAAMKADRQVEAVKAELMKRNLDFDGKLDHKLDKDGQVTELAFLTENVTDISPVRALTGLRKLVCSGSAFDKKRLADLAPLKGLQLTNLDCNNTNVADLTPLAGMKLASLRLQSTQVSDLSPLEGMPLTMLSCPYAPVSNLAPLKGMQLTGLHLSYTKVSDLAPLKGMQLTFLDFNATPVTDLSPLKGMKLTTLRCKYTKVADLSLLRGMPLKELECDIELAKRHAEMLRSIKTLENINGKSPAEFWKEVSVAPPPLDPAWFKEVATMSTAKQVDAVAKKLQDLNPDFDGKVDHQVADGVVTELKFETDHVTDISPVRALVGLKVLRCSASAPEKGILVDISPLKGLQLSSLNIAGNKVPDLELLRESR